MHRRYHLPATLQIHNDYTDDELLAFIEDEREHFKPSSYLESYANWYVITGIPSAPASKLEKLKQFFTKFFKLADAEFDFPLENDKTIGILFVQTKTDLLPFHQKMMDKKHQLFITTLSNIDDTPSHLVSNETPLPTFDADMVIHHQKTSFKTMNNEGKDTEIISKVFKDSYALIKDNKVLVNQLGFKHPLCKDVLFSPDYQLMATWSPHPIDAVQHAMPISTHGANVLLYHTSGYFLRAFTLSPGTTLSESVLFTDDSQYCLCLSDCLHVCSSTGDYHTVATSATQFKACPMPYGGTDYQIALFTMGTTNAPSRIVLIDLHGTILASRNLFNIHQCQLSFDPRGIYLVAGVVKLNKSKKVIASSLELFYLKSKTITIASYSMALQRLHSLEWDAKQARLVVISCPEDRVQNQQKLVQQARDAEVSVDHVAKMGVPGHMVVRFLEVSDRVFDELLVLEGTGYNAIHCSPGGRMVALIGVGECKDPLTWYDLGASDNRPMKRDMIIRETIEAVKDVGDDAEGERVALQILKPPVCLVKKDEQVRKSTLVWDPTGRYMSAVIPGGSDAGYRLYDMMGQLMWQERLSGMSKMEFKPVKETLLPSGHVKKIKHNLSSYMARFEAEDEVKKRAKNVEMDKQMRETWTKWEAFRETCRAWREETKALRHEAAKQDYQFPTKMALEDYYSDSEDYCFDLRKGQCGYEEVISK